MIFFLFTEFFEFFILQCRCLSCKQSRTVVVMESFIIYHYTTVWEFFPAVKIFSLLSNALSWETFFRRRRDLSAAKNVINSNFFFTIKQELSYSVDGFSVDFVLMFWYNKVQSLCFGRITNFFLSHFLMLSILRAG